MTKQRKDLAINSECPDLIDLFVQAYESKYGHISSMELQQKFLDGIIFWSDLDVEEATSIVVNDGPLDLDSKLIKTETLQQILDVLCSFTMGDGLTGLFNRRYFDLRIVYEMRRAHRDYVPISIILADVDDFKKVNDQYGHDVGDKALKLVSRVFMDTLRQTDVITRYGGEEFAVLLPGTGIREAIHAAERVRVGLEKASIQANNTEVKITISAGVATYFAGAQLSAEQFVKQADLALYEAKNSGRNRVKEAAAPPPISKGVSAAEKEELFR